MSHHDKAKEKGGDMKSGTGKPASKGGAKGATKKK